MNRSRALLNRLHGLSLAILLLMITACSGGSETFYTGKLIELDFSSVEKIEDEAWLEIDGIRFTHYKDFQKAHQDEFSLQATESVWMETENAVYPHAIAVTLGSHLKSVQNEREDEQSRIMIARELLLYGQSILRLKREDGEEFTIKTSPGYGVPITVLE